MSKVKSKMAEGREEEDTGDDVQQGGDEPQQATQERGEGSRGGKPGFSKQNKGEMGTRNPEISFERTLSMMIEDPQCGV